MTQQSNITTLSSLFTRINENFSIIVNQIKSRVKSSELAVVAKTGNYVDLSNRPSIPSKTSDLTNDSGFLTSHQDISGKANTADLSAVATSGSYADLSNKPSIPSKTSDLTNDSGFQTASDVATAISNASLLTKEIVQSLPTAANADENTIYLILSNDGSGDDLYDEYLLVNNALEKIGSTRVDLTNYYTKTQMDDYIEDLFDGTITQLTDADFVNSNGPQTEYVEDRPGLPYIDP